MSIKKHSAHNDHSEDTRLALLEQSVDHIHEILIRFEKRFDKIDDRFNKIDDRFNKIDDDIKEVRTELQNDIKEVRTELRDEMRHYFIWTMGVFVTVSGGIIGAIGHGFHWF